MSNTGAIRAGRAYVEVYADNSPLRRGLRKAEQNIKEFGNAIGKIGKYSLAAGTLIATGMGKAALFTGNMAEKLMVMSKSTGMSIEKISALNYAAKVLDVDINVLGVALKFLSKNLYAAATEGGEIRKVFDNLGVSVSDLTQISSDEKLAKLADAFSNIDNPVERAAMALKIFGRNGTAMLPFLLEGSARIRNIMNEAAEFGIVLSTKDVEAAAQFKDQLDKLWEVIKAGTFSLGKSLIPVLQTLSKKLIDSALMIKQWIETHNQAIITALTWSKNLIITGIALKSLQAATNLASDSLKAFMVVQKLAVVSSINLWNTIKKMHNALIALSVTSPNLLKLSHVGMLFNGLGVFLKNNAKAIAVFTVAIAALVFWLDRWKKKQEELDETLNKASSIGSNKNLSNDEKLKLMDAMIKRQEQKVKDAQANDILGGKPMHGGRTIFNPETPRWERSTLQQMELLHKLRQERKKIIQDIDTEEKDKTTEKVARDIENAETIMDAEEDSIKKIHELEIELIDDEYRRELARINSSYEEEKTKLKELGATQLTLDNAEKARRLEIAKLDQETRKKKQEENRRYIEEATGLENTINNDIARSQLDRIEDKWERERAEINYYYDQQKKNIEETASEEDKLRLGLLNEKARDEALKALDRRKQAEIDEINKDVQREISDLQIDTMKGVSAKEKEIMKLELDRKKALEDAAKTGENTDLINQLYNLKLKQIQLSRESVMPMGNTQGTFSPYYISQMWSNLGGGIWNGILQETRKIAKNTERMAEDGPDD
jgi:hypothetical protein